MFLSSGLWDRFRETDVNADMISGLATEVVNLIPSKEPVSSMALAPPVSCSRTGSYLQVSAPGRGDGPTGIHDRHESV